MYVILITGYYNQKMLTMTPLFVTLGVIGPLQIVIIVALFLLLFGGKKIPELMRGMGRGVKEFKDAVNKDYTAEDKTAGGDNNKKLEA